MGDALIPPSILGDHEPLYYPAFDEFNQSIRDDVRCRSRHLITPVLLIHSCAGL